MLGAHEKTHWRDGAHETMSPAMMGGLVVGVSLAGALLFCTALCLGLWCRRLRGHAGDPSPATFLVSKRKPGPYAPPDHPMAFVMPTITHSEAGSEPRTPPPTMTLSPTPTERSKGLGSTTPTPTTTPEHHGLYCPIRDGGVTTASTFSSSSFPVTFSLPPTYTPLHPPTYTPFHLTTCTPLPTTTTTTSPLSSVSPARPRSASPHGFLRTSPHTPSLSLPLGSRRWWPGPQCSPGTPPALLPRNLYARKGTQGLEELRSAFQHPFLTSDPLSPDPGDVTTPDSVDGWGPVWTPASSIGSGGGCGLGELRVRLRYSIRSRLLRLTVLSADQLPLRLGPDPVDTYTKAVLLPEKRVRFTTRVIAATDNASFNAAFTHAARPSRLAHATLRLSVCQVTDCGRRVVVGYASVGLASTGLRAGLTHDLDTGPLTLHLQESAPDQQVGGGGQVEVGLGWERETSDLTIRICNLTGLHLQHQLPLHDIAQVYVKVTVYTNNTILCWRRTSPRALEGQVTVFQEELTLHMPELDLDATHLVLSARLRTKPGCGRRVVGSCVLGCGGCVGEEGRHHWHDMLRAAPDLVLRSHPLAAHAHAHDALPMGPVDPEEDHEGPPSELVDTPHVHYLQGYDGSPSVSSTQTTPTSPPIIQTTPTSPSISQTTPTSPPISQTTPTSPPITQTTPTSPPITQSTPISPPITQTTPTSPLTTQATPTSPLTTQTTPTSPPTTQTTPTSPPITQTTPTSPPITQSTPINPPITQTTPTSPLTTQTTPTSPPTTQTTPTSPPTTQTTPTSPPITQSTPTSPPITQTTPTSPPITQTTPTSPPITQSTPISPPITQTTPTSPLTTQTTPTSPLTTQTTPISPPITHTTPTSPPTTQTTPTSPPTTHTPPIYPDIHTDNRYHHEHNSNGSSSSGPDGLPQPPPLLPPASNLLTLPAYNLPLQSPPSAADNLLPPPANNLPQLPNHDNHTATHLNAHHNNHTHHTM